MSRSQWESVYRAILKETGDIDAATEAADLAVEETERNRNGKDKKAPKFSE